MGISSAGDSVEAEFRRLTGFAKPDKAKLGDATFMHAGVRRYVEVKKCSKNTLNQVRPAKYTPLVVKDVRDGQWYVVPPQVVVAEAIRKTRGQHSESPIECCTLSLKRLETFQVDAGKLQEKVVEACVAGDELAGIPPLLRGHIDAIRAIVERDREALKKEF